MKLQIEYFQRHGADLPIVFHTNYTNLLLHFENEIHLLELIFQPPDHYTFDILRPQLSFKDKGTGSIRYFESIGEPAIVYYENYFTFICGWARNLPSTKFSVVECPDDELWNLFTYFYKDWVEEQKVECPEQLKEEHPDAFRVYEHRLLSIKENYGTWLSDLVNYYKRHTDDKCKNKIYV